MFGTAARPSRLAPDRRRAVALLGGAFCFARSCRGRDPHPRPDRFGPAFDLFDGLAAHGWPKKRVSRRACLRYAGRLRQVEGFDELQAEKLPTNSGDPLVRLHRLRGGRKIHEQLQRGLWRRRRIIP